MSPHATVRAPSGAGPADALRIAEAACAERALRQDALLEALLLRARFAGPDARGPSDAAGGQSFEAAEVMRGVIESDWFHAAPAVFLLTRPCSWSVRVGTPLLELFPHPRALADASFASHDLELLP